MVAGDSREIKMKWKLNKEEGKHKKRQFDFHGFF
jgi:hypothetical protein